MMTYIIKTLIRNKKGMLLTIGIIVISSVSFIVCNEFKIKEETQKNNLYKTIEVSAELYNSANSMKRITQDQIDILKDSEFVKEDYRELITKGYVLYPEISLGNQVKYGEEFFYEQYLLGTSDINGIEAIQREAVAYTLFNDKKLEKENCLVLKDYYINSNKSNIGLTSLNNITDGETISLPCNIIGTFTLKEYAASYNFGSIIAIVNIDYLLDHFSMLYQGKAFDKVLLGYTKYRMQLTNLDRLPEFTSLTDKYFPPQSDIKIFIDNQSLIDLEMPMEKRIDMLNIVLPILYVSIIVICSTTALLSSRGFIKEIAIFHSLGIKQSKVITMLVSRQMIIALISILLIYTLVLICNLSFHAIGIISSLVYILISYLYIVYLFKLTIRKLFSIFE